MIRCEGQPGGRKGWERDLTEGSRRREVESAHSEGRGEDGADGEEPESGGQAQVLDESVREESSSEDSERSPEDGGAEGPGADVEVRVVVLEEVAGVVRPAVASRVPEEG